VREVLVRSGRCCCLCHKFCGTKIELHHIIPVEQSGDDSLENCIPVCFDCHADIGHYNDKHPRGRKYSPGELRQHRDDWFARVTNTAPPASGSREIDRQLLARVWKLLGASGAHEFARDHDFGASFRASDAFPWFDLGHDLDRPETEFQDVELEKLRGNLLRSAKNFVSKIAEYTSPLASPKLQGFDSLFKSAYREEYRARAEKLNEFSSVAAETYMVLIREGMRKLDLGIFDLERLGNAEGGNA
jgi:hypothetical protein